MIFIYFTGFFCYLSHFSEPRIEDLDKLRVEVVNRMNSQRISCGETQTYRVMEDLFSTFFSEIVEVELKIGKRLPAEDILSQLNSKLDLIYKENLNWVFVFSREIAGFNKYEPIFLRKNVPIFDGYYTGHYSKVNSYFILRYFAQGQMIDDSYPIKVENRNYLQFLDSQLTNLFKKSNGLDTSYKLNQMIDMPLRKPVLIFYFTCDKLDCKNNVTFFVGTSPRRSVFTETILLTPPGASPLYVTTLIE